jgi:hypothetical protein
MNSLVPDVGGHHKNDLALSPSFTITHREMDLARDLPDRLFRHCRVE